MKIDEARLNRRINALKESAKRRNRYTDEQLATFLDISTGTLRNKTCRHELYTLSIRDVAMLRKLAGEELDFVGL